MTHYPLNALKSTSVVGFTVLGKVIAISHVGVRLMRKEQQYMSLRSTTNRVTSAATLFASIAVVCYAQLNITAQANSASHVAAEMTKGKRDWTSEAQSMIDIEWRVPAAQSRGVQGVSFALQSVTQINPLSESSQNNSSEDFSFVNTGARSSVEA